MMRLLGCMFFALALTGVLASCARERQQPVNEPPCASDATKPVLKSDDTQETDTHDRKPDRVKIKLPPPANTPPSEPPNVEPGSGQLMEPIVPLRTIGGTNSAITTLEVHLVTESAAMLELWLRHNRVEAAPKIDFANEMVLAVFSGARRSKPAEFHQALKGRRYYVDLELGPESEQTGEAAFALFVMPRLDAPIVVENRIWPDKKVPARFETLAVLQSDKPLLPEHAWWPVQQFSGNDSAIGDAEGKAEVVITYGLDNLWRQFAPGKAAPERKGGAGILILGGKTQNGARLALYEVLMGANTLVFRFERGIEEGPARDTMPYLVLELPQIDDPSEPELSLFFEEREPGEKLPRFKGVEQKSVFIVEYKK
ncbi:MAG: hypothetical protein IT461_12455 [Planctomycetes bacterium]|nr:hypothetical protein [Planctomycetota bacterium]